MELDDLIIFLAVPVIIILIVALNTWVTNLIDKYKEYKHKRKLKNAKSVIKCCGDKYTVNLKTYDEVIFAIDEQKNITTYLYKDTHHDMVKKVMQNTIIYIISSPTYLAECTTPDDKIGIFKNLKPDSPAKYVLYRGENLKPELYKDDNDVPDLVKNFIQEIENAIEPYIEKYNKDE